MVRQREGEWPPSLHFGYALLLSTCRTKRIDMKHGIIGPQDASEAETGETLRPAKSLPTLA